MITAVLFLRQHAVNCRHVVRRLSSSTVRATAALPFVPGLSGVKPLLSSPVKDAHGSAPTTRSNDVLRQHFYQCLSAGYQLPTVCYNAVMKRSIIDPLSNLTLYDLPTVAGHDGRKDAPQVSGNITVVGDRDQSSVANEMLLVNMLQIRRKKMKKHKLRKLRKRQRFVMRRRRQLKEKRKERAIQQYEREQAKLGEQYSAEQYVDEQLALARKSGWHIDIITEFNRERQKEHSAAASSDSSSGKQ